MSALHTRRALSCEAHLEEPPGWALVETKASDYSPFFLLRIEIRSRSDGEIHLAVKLGFYLPCLLLSRQPSPLFLRTPRTHAPFALNSI